VNEHIIYDKMISLVEMSYTNHQIFSPFSIMSCGRTSNKIKNFLRFIANTYDLIKISKLTKRKLKAWQIT